MFGDRDDSWQPGRRIWNQHAYFVTNINDDGSLPLVAAPNWSTYNHFRSGDLTAGAGSERPDLTLAQPGLCEAECDDGRLLLWIHPGNQGLADVASVHDPVLELFAVVGGAETLVQSTPLGDVPAGAFQSAVVHEVTGLDFATVEAFVARVSSDLPECDETNDEHRWEGPFCAP